PRPADRRGVRRAHQRGVVELDADARDDRGGGPAARAGLPDPDDRGRRRAPAGRAAFRARRRRGARLDAREPPPPRRASRPRRERPQSLAAVEAAVDRAEHGVVVSLADGRKLNAPLLIAADGRNSRTREEAGIRVARWKYDHQAIVSVLRHERPHDHIAY